MDPTRPVDPKRGSTTGLRAITPGAARNIAPASSGANVSEVAPTTAVVDTRSSGVIETARSETSRIDASRLEELSERIEQGRYDVDPDALADRILDDALGPEIQG